MVEIKGTAVKDTVEAVKKRSGEHTYDKIITSLDGETRKIFERNYTILATLWYPLDVFVRFLELDIKLTAGGNENELIKRSEALIEKQLRGIFKVFVKLGSPQFVLSQISNVHKSYFRGVTIEITMEDQNKAIIKYTGFEKQHRLIGLSIIGFYRKALEISGAKKVEAKYSTSIEEGKGFCELVITWTNK